MTRIYSKRGRVCLLVLLIAIVPSLTRSEEPFPEFCEKVSKELLGGLAIPYGRKAAPDGTVYCEGLLRTPISMRPPGVISLKQVQPRLAGFRRKTFALLSWCDSAVDPAFIKLRSIAGPSYALDALRSSGFQWSADVLAAAQLDWTSIAALTTRMIPVGGQRFPVVFPSRIGAGYSSEYVFLIQTAKPLNVSQAFIEATDLKSPPEIVPVALQNGPTADTWTAQLSFDKRPEGVYRVTFQEAADQAGASTKPINIFHGTCGIK